MQGPRDTGTALSLNPRQRRGGRLNRVFSLVPCHSSVLCFRPFSDPRWCLFKMHRWRGEGGRRSRRRSSCVSRRHYFKGLPSGPPLDGRAPLGGFVEWGVVSLQAQEGPRDGRSGALSTERCPRRRLIQNPELCLPPPRHPGLDLSFPVHEMESLVQILATCRVSGAPGRNNECESALPDANVITPHNYT